MTKEKNKSLDLYNDLYSIEENIADELLDCLPDNTKAEIFSDTKTDTTKFIGAMITDYIGKILICNPEKCPYKSTCPLIEKEIAPVGQLCPIEVITQNSKRKMLINSMFESGSGDIYDKIDVDDLVSLDMMIKRINTMILEEGSMVEDVKGVVQRTGERITGPVVHPLYPILQKFLDMREKKLARLSKEKQQNEELDDIYAAIEEQKKKDTTEDADYEIVGEEIANNKNSNLNDDYYNRRDGEMSEQQEKEEEQ